MSNVIDWAAGLQVAITVTDANGVVVEMNAASISTFAKSGGAALVGQDVRACHPPAARERLEHIYETRQPNHYTIRKCCVARPEAIVVAPRLAQACSPPRVPDDRSACDPGWRAIGTTG